MDDVTRRDVLKLAAAAGAAAVIGIGDTSAAAQDQNKETQGHLIEDRKRVIECGMTEADLLTQAAIIEFLHLHAVEQGRAPGRLKQTGQTFDERGLARTAGKDREQLRRQVTFLQAFYNFGRPHQSLRLALAVWEEPDVGLFQRKWQPRTPGMAAGLTDHVWTFRELLTVKFEPISNQSISR